MSAFTKVHTMQVHLTPKSANAKTGPIPVSTTASDSCPTNCAMKAECYAATGPLALHWKAVSTGARGTDWPTFTAAVAALPDGQLWRHNQAGDLPQTDGTVDAAKLGQLVAANTGKRGFTYSHHRDTESINWIRHANAWGFTVNLSANDLQDADMLADHAAGPVVVVLPSTQTTNTTTPKGRTVVVCPATQRADVSCATCQLCQRQRSAIVGFPAHGSRHRVINLRLAA
jgi:hypothetical protein